MAFPRLFFATLAAVLLAASCDNRPLAGGVGLGGGGSTTVGLGGSTTRSTGDAGDAGDAGQEAGDAGQEGG